MNFVPKSEQEVQTLPLLEPGFYQFTVDNASNETSKNGNDMIKLVLSIWDKDGGVHHCFDYLLEAMAYKLRHFCAATGLMQRYESGKLDAMDCVGKSGRVEISVKHGAMKENGERYPSSNSVKDYVPATKAQSGLPQNEEVDTDVPF